MTATRLLLACAALCVAAPAQSAAQKGVLELVSGERIAGSLATEQAESGFAWASPQFRTPLLFDATALSCATFEPVADTWQAAGEWRVSLQGGDVLFGDLTGLDAETLTLATARHGRLSIPRTAVAELQRRTGGSTIYRGPNCIFEWQQRSVASVTTWRAAATSLVTQLPGTELFRDGLLADGCRIDCTLSWTGNPGFRMVLGAVPEGQPAGSPIVLEVWDDLLVAFREREQGIDLVQLQGPIRDQGSVRLRIHLQQGQATFTGESGADLGRLPFGNAGTGIAIRQKHEGELRLDDLRVERTDNTLRSLPAQEVRGYDAATATFTLSEGTLAAAAVEAIRFAAATPAAQPAEILLQDGTRLSGDYRGIAAGSLRMQTGWAAEPVTTSVSAVKQLRVEGNKRPRVQEQFKLAIKEDRFLGKIVAWSPGDNTVHWQPTLGKAPAVLQTSDDLRFDLAINSAYFVARKDYPHRILFTNRDCTACNVVAITPDTITILEPFHGNRREVPSICVKALEFDPRALRRIADDARSEMAITDQTARRHQLLEARKQRERNFIDAGRRETLLALPRKYKGNPPTHLVIAENGDVMRGILQSVTAEAVNFEMSLVSNATVPRDRVTAMVLFSPEPKGDAVAPADTKGLVLEVTLDKETRLSILVTGADAKSISGISPFVGEVTIPWEDIVSMVSGSLRGNAQGFFTAWHLTPMKEPPY